MPPAENKAAQMQSKIAQGGGKMTTQAYEQQLREWWTANGKRMASLAGDEKEAKQLFVTATNVLAKTPKLLECDPASIFACLLSSAETLLYPGAAQECAYVPLNNGKTGKKEANFWVMYQGLVKQAFYGGFVKSIACDVVYSNDDVFDYRKGTDSFLHHKPRIGTLKERGERFCAYVAFVTKYGETQFEIVSIDFCEHIKNKSPGGKMKDSPWNSDEYNYNQMCKKTAFKQGVRWIPKSARMVATLEADQDEVEEARRPVVFDMSLASVVSPSKGPNGAEAKEAEEPITPPPRPEVKALEHDEPIVMDFTQQREPEPVMAQQQKSMPGAERFPPGESS